MHARDGVIDPHTKRISDARYRPIGRLYANRYCTTRQRFTLPRASCLTDPRRAQKPQ